MGERTTVWMFRTSDAAAYRQALESAVEAGRGTVLWDTPRSEGQVPLRVLEHPRVCIQWFPYLSGAEHLVAKLVGTRLGVPWIEARIQEGDHWDYSFYFGFEHVHSFSTRTTYWGNRAYTLSDARAAALRLAHDWGVEHDAIVQYHRPWDSPPWRRVHWLRRKGRAYPNDTSEYGDIWQLYDFISVLGWENIFEESAPHAVTPLELDRLRAAVQELSAEPSIGP